MAEIDAWRDRELPPSQPSEEELLSAASVLVVDDEIGMRNFLVKTLTPVCAFVADAATTAEATKLLDQHRFDIVILDNVMPGQRGVDWLTEQHRIGFFSEAILITAHADLETAIAALRAGAFDFLLKPFRSSQILNAVARSLDRTTLRRENELLRHQLNTDRDLLRRRGTLLGSSDAIQKVRTVLLRCAQLPSNVIIRGEAGSGKEVAARMLHRASSRAEKPFVPLSCGVYPGDNFAERLFGKVLDGSTEGDRRDGLLMAAEGGTLFLDDIDELSPAAQAALVQVIDAKRFRPINAARDLPVDVRFVCSSTKSLQKEVKAKRFREDLYYSLNVLEVDLPPLRERATDVIDCAEFFLAHIARELRVEAPDIPTSTRSKLMRHPWPGNVLELRNHIERALIHDDLEYGLDFDPEDYEADTMAAVERRHILQTLEICGGNRAEAARRLGLSRKTIDRKCAAWDL